VAAPVLVDEDGVLIYGHGRRRAAELLGYPELPVCVAKGWTEQEKKAYRIADNSSHDNSSFDLPVLKLEMAALKGFDFKALGFPEIKLTKIPAAADPDATPEPPKRATARAGDVWALGTHRVVAGDCTDAATWKMLFGTQRAAMVFTDPPYGVSYKGRSGNFEVIEGDDKRRDELYKMLTMSLREMAGVASSEAAFYIWHATSSREDFSRR
jgi:hypothetical protein